MPQLISDLQSLSDLQSGWEGVHRMRKRMKLLTVATFAFGAPTSPAIAKVIYNLPVLLAFDVLRETLRTARKEGLFASKGSQLGDLMDAARTAIPWLDWQELRDGVRRRNAIAHDGQLFEAKQCWADMSGIEAQLVEWGVVVESTDT